MPSSKHFAAFTSDFGSVHNRSVSQNPWLYRLQRELNSLVDLRLYAERLPTSERQEILCAVCLEKNVPEPHPDATARIVECPLYRDGRRLCGQGEQT